MAKRQIRDYVFNPGISGSGNVKILDKVQQNQILLITNITDNKILYNFADATNKILVEFSDAYDAAFPYASETSNGVTTIHFLFDTSDQSSTDSIQILIEDEEVTFRPYRFGTDAIERMRVATPQSMLDADFEYGIQPTKWQTIDFMRGYPSIYELPGSDLVVNSITTNASSTTSGVGESLITVTTTETHGFSVGSPFRITGLNDNVSGSSRAQGSFIVNSIPSTTSFTYYAKGRVGLTNGESLGTTYLQLRKGGFYTGSAVGSPTFNVLTNGSSGSFASNLITRSGSNRISYTGIATFSVGSPLTGAGLLLGTQVTGISTLSGSTTFKSNVVAPSNQIEVNNSTGIEIGSALDDGTGYSTFVTNINGNTLSLSDPILVNKTGSSDQVGILTGVNNNFGYGTGALLRVQREDGRYMVQISSVVKSATGNSGSNQINVGNVIGVVLGQSVSGTGIGAGATVTGFVGISTVTLSTNNVTAVSGNVTFVKPGTLYNPGDVIQIDGQFLGGTSGENDLRVKVLSVAPVTSGITSIVTNKNITTFGEAQLSTAQFKVGGSSMLLNPTAGSTDYISAPTNPDFNFGTDDFTVEFWIYRNRIGVSEILYDMRSASPTEVAPTIQINNSNQIVYFVNGSARITSTDTVTASVWNHIAISRRSGSTKLFINGFVQGSEYTDSNNYPQKPIYFGARYDGTSGFYGYVDQLKVRKGYGKYVDNFSPYAFFTQTDAYTVLFLRFDGPNNSTFIIDESYGKSIPRDRFYQVSGTTAGSGTGAQFTVLRTGGISPSYTLQQIINGGSNYSTNDTIVVDGSVLGGFSGLNDLTITVTGQSGGVITSVSLSGTADSGNQTYQAISGPTTGSGATFNISKSGGSYSATVNQGGSGYYPGYTILLSGSDMNGTAPTNDAVITVTSVVEDDSDNSIPIGKINTVSISGTPVATDSLTYYPSTSISEVTTGNIPNLTSISFSAIAKIQVSLPNHGFVPGDTVIASITSVGSNHNLASGPFIIEKVPSLNLLEYTARAPGQIASGLIGVIYPRPDCFYIHRPFDGGVQLGTGGPSHGAHAIRQSKKYLRYQSGKGIMYTTGTLFAPSYDLRSITANGTSVGSIITVTTDDNDHGLQVGAEIALSDIVTSGYNNHYNVNSIIDENTFTVLALNTLGSTTAVLGTQAQVSLYKWKGATVRAGAFDDQNGIFWQYDGINLAVGFRSGTYQLAGTITVNPDSNQISGTNTRFQDQLVVGDRIIIRGMTHVVTKIDSQSQLSITPDYRGVVTASSVKCALVKETIFPQSDWNIDRADGTGPSGYNIKVNRMQMIGFQYTWYGAGFIDWMLRGPNGDYLFVHRLKNNNRNTEAFMRSGNLPVRYEVINEGPKTKLTSNVGVASTTMQVENASLFPTSGSLYIDNELINYTGISSNTFIGLTRSASFSNFASGSPRTYTAGPAATHTSGTGVILISNTATPIISHWGSAFLTDGLFDSDRGYIFNYQAVSFPVSTIKSTAFLIRLAPSVSNALIGDLGARELINRAQLLLQGIEFTPTSGTNSQSVIIEGILNPQNYPSNPANIQWFGLSNAGAGGQPSFAQIANGGTVTWEGAISPITVTNAVTQNFRTNFVIFNRAATAGVRIGMTVTANGLPGGTTVVGFANLDATNWYIQLSQTIQPGNAGSTSFTFASPVFALPGETVFSFAGDATAKSALDLTSLKELNNTPIGGRGTFPNGPDVLAINIYSTGGSPFSGSIALRWGEAQA